MNINNFNIVHYNINSITANGRLDPMADVFFWNGFECFIKNSYFSEKHLAYTY